jgi:hypothetical protein
MFWRCEEVSLSSAEKRLRVDSDFIPRIDLTLMRTDRIIDKHEI